MRIALFGNGKMGREVRRLAGVHGHDVVVWVAHARPDDEDLVARVREADGVIEFSGGESVLAHVETALRAGVPIVVGTTGWEERLDEVQRAVREAGGTLVHGANFSLGAYLFEKVVRNAARLFGTVGAYDPYVTERHHREKKDHPSGTALRLAEAIVAETPEKRTLRIGDPRGRIEPAAVHVTSVRAGWEPGTHEVGFEGPDDAVRLRHAVRDRATFAAGALCALGAAAERAGVWEFRALMDAFTEGRDT